MTQAHPTYPELELLHLGEPLDDVRRHVESCELCRRSLEGFEADTRQLLERESPDAFVLRLRGEAARRRRRSSLPALGGALALAASVAALFLTDPFGPELAGRANDSAVATGSPTTQAESLVTKGFQPLRIIRKRGEEQRTLVGDVTVVPGDRVRLSFDLEHSGRIVGGVLLDEGGWQQLFQGDFAAGSHTPLATLRADDEPGGGLLLVGPPDAVARAREGHIDRSVLTARILWQKEQSGSATPSSAVPTEPAP